MVICMTKKEKKFGYNNNSLIVINMIWTDVITIRGFHCIFMPIRQENNKRNRTVIDLLQNILYDIPEFYN